MDLELFIDDTPEPATTSNLLGVASMFRRNTTSTLVIFDVEFSSSGDALISVGEVYARNATQINPVATLRLSAEECDTLITRLTR